jgi:hypothetical protein
VRLRRSRTNNDEGKEHGVGEDQEVCTQVGHLIDCEDVEDHAVGVDEFLQARVSATVPLYIRTSSVFAHKDHEYVPSRKHKVWMEDSDELPHSL